MKDDNAFGQMLRQRREQLGLTQDQLAGRAGISKPYLSTIETGKAANPPSDGVLERLEEGLALEPMTLMHQADIARTPPYVLHSLQQHQLVADKYRQMLRHVLDRAGADGQINLEVALEQLAAGTGPAAQTSHPSAGGIPIINKASAGYPQGFTDLDYPVGIAEEYLQLPGLSDPNGFAVHVSGDSMSPEYADGDIVVFAPNRPATNGQACFVRFAEDQGATFKRVYTDSPDAIRLQPINPAYAPAVYRPDQITGIYPAVAKISLL